MELLNHRLVWCHGPRPEYIMDNDEWDGIYIPARQLPLVRPRDLAIIPGGNAHLDSFAAFCERTLGSSGRILRTSGKSYLADQDIDGELLSELEKRCTPKDKWRLVPYSMTPDFEKWSSKIQVPVFGDQSVFVDRFGHKGILHPESCVQKGLLSKAVPDLYVPRGYICKTREQLTQAWENLCRSPALIKPVQGATGEGILLVTSRDDLKGYNFPMGDVVLEERLDSDRSVSVQFNGFWRFGEPTDQEVNKFRWEGNTGPSELSCGLRIKLGRITQDLLVFLKSQGLQGPGGFDFVIKDEIPYLVDVNIGRFTGAHIPKIFMSIYAPGQRFRTWKIDPKVSIDEFWERLQQKDIAFTPPISHSGVFPICYLPGMWSMLMAIGESNAELKHLYDEANSCI